MLTGIKKGDILIRLTAGNGDDYDFTRGKQYIVHRMGPKGGVYVFDDSNRERSASSPNDWKKNDKIWFKKGEWVIWDQPTCGGLKTGNSYQVVNPDRNAYPDTIVEVKDDTGFTRTMYQWKFKKHKTMEKTYAIKESFIKLAHEKACNEWKKRIEEEVPELFPKGRYKVGQRIRGKSGTTVFLIVGGLTGNAVLVSLTSGFATSASVPVKDQHAITYEEMYKLAGVHNMEILP